MTREMRCCRRKIRYTNMVVAMKHMIDLATRQQALALHAYCCENCGGIHVGNLLPSRVRLDIRNHLAERPIVAKLICKLLANNPRCPAAAPPT